MQKSLRASAPSVYDREAVSAIARASNCDLYGKGINRNLTTGLDAAAMWFRQSLSGRGLVPSASDIELLKRVSRIAGKVAVSGALLDRQMRGAEDITPDTPRHLYRNYLGQRSRLTGLLMVDDDVEGFLFGRLATAMLYGEDCGPDRLERILVRLIDSTSDPASVGAAAKDVGELASLGANRMQAMRNTMLQPRHSGDLAMNGWIDDMLNLYQRVTGRKAATSAISAGRPNEGVASGPLIRFLMAAFEPIAEILTANGQRVPALFEDAWASRVRTARKAKARSKPKKVEATSGPK